VFQDVHIRGCNLQGAFYKVHSKRCILGGAH